MHDIEAGDLSRRCAAWKRLGGGELVDCRDHHVEMSILDWHRFPKPKLQPTWRRLIKLLLQYRGAATDAESVRVYQRDRFGTSTDETCVVELSSLAAKNLQADRDRFLHRQHRISILRERIENYKPEWVVLYGVDVNSRMAWNSMVGVPIEVGQLYQFASSRLILMKHPQDRVADASWLEDTDLLVDPLRYRNRER